MPLVWWLAQSGTVACDAQGIGVQTTPRAVAALPPLDDSTVITIERGPCFGMCPDYSVTLYGSGRVEFEGRHYVCAKGHRTEKVEAGAVRSLVARLIAAGYFDLSWKGGPFATDAPTVMTSLRHAGRARSIRHYHGDVGAPRWLEELEDHIDEVARTARWLPERKDHRPVCHRDDGTVETVVP